MFTRAIEVGYMTCLQDVRRGGYDLAPSQCAVSGGEAAADNDRTSATAAPVTAGPGSIRDHGARLAAQTWLICG